MAEYPFDEKFRLTVEQQEIDWSWLVRPAPSMVTRTRPPRWIGNRDRALPGYSSEAVDQIVAKLVSVPIEDLVELAVRDIDENREQSPALEVLKAAETRQVFNRAKSLCASKNPRYRMIGVRVMFHRTGFKFEDEARMIVFGLAEREADEDVWEMLASALTHFRMEERSRYLHRYVHSNKANLRYAVACSLGAQMDELAIQSLIALSRDEDDDVRNWATFGLHNGFYDPEEDEIEIHADVCDALFARTCDPHDETRHEAIEGLAKLKDERVLKPLIKALQARSVWEMTVKGAKSIGHPSLLPHLIKLRGWWDCNPELLEEAIAKCSRNEPIPE
jgi:FOG: HEAT repeat